MSPVEACAWAAGRLLVPWLLYRLAARWPNREADLYAGMADAWRRGINDCGCPDIYYCPTAEEIECPRHGGFDICCSQPERHVPARLGADQ